MSQQDASLYSSPVIVIPFEEGPEDAEKEAREWSQSMPELASGDLRDGPNLRMMAFKENWKRCMRQVQAIVFELHEKITDELIDFVEDAYVPSEIVLPFAEIPVAVVAGDSSSITVVFDSLSKHHARLDAESDSALDLCISLSPKLFSSLPLALRAIVSGFITHEKISTKHPPPRKRAHATVLQNHDLTMLKAWYDHVQTGENLGKLVVLIPSVELCDPHVLTDLVHICSLHIPQLPLIFVLGTSTSSNVLETMLPLSSRINIRTNKFQLQGGNSLFEALVTGLFLDYRFSTGFHLTASAFERIWDSYTHQEQSVESFLSTLKLILMNHFEQPTSVFHRHEMLGDVKPALRQMRYPESSGFLSDLRASVKRSIVVFPDSSPTALARQNASDGEISDFGLLEYVSQARQLFTQRSQRFRLSLRLLRHIIIVLRTNSQDANAHLANLLRSALKGTLPQREMDWLATKIKKSSVERLQAVVNTVDRFCVDLPERLKVFVKEFHEGVSEWKDTLEEVAVAVKATPSAKSSPTKPSKSSSSLYKMPETVVHPAQADASNRIVDWLIVFLRGNLSPMDDVPLKEIWTLDSQDNPIELLNPSLLHSVMNALASTENILSSLSSESKGDDPILSHLPDTAVVLRRYLESGKMINAYDWFESFAIAMRGENRRLVDTMETDGEDSPSAGAGSQYGAEWKREVQARFLRSLHELEWIGLLKSTKRKKDHFLRTVFDPPR